MSGVTLCGSEEPDYRVIYLQPRCCADPYEGRQWCEDPQDPCPECGAKWIRFVRAGRPKRTERDEARGTPE